MDGSTVHLTFVQKFANFTVIIVEHLIFSSLQPQQDGLVEIWCYIKKTELNPNFKKKKSDLIAM